MNTVPRIDHDLETITIPDIEIADGWAVSEIETLEDCDDAFAYLMAAVAEIEYQLEQHQLGVVVSADPTWKARATRALKYKRAGLQLVGYARGRIADAAKRNFAARQDRVLLDYIRSICPREQYHAWVIASGVASLTGTEAAA